MKCKNIKCDKDHNGSFGKGDYCSRPCANSRIRTEESKKKTSESKKRFDLLHPKIKIQKYTTCIVCGDEFESRQRAVCCDKECYHFLLSLKRQEAIKEKGTSNFKTKQESFSYKFVKDIITDSKLEQAAIKYLIDELQVDRIEKYQNILNFWEGESHRTFNPDFYVKKGDKIYIVEVKMKWSQNSTHTYNRTIPYKKEALEKFCKEKGYEMIWLDFDYDVKFRDIYREHIK